MASKRDPRYSRAVGEKPHIGRRYVRDGRVRIEWTEHGRRRSKTIGSNTAANRKKADAALAQILGTLGGEGSATSPDPSFELPDPVRTAALQLIDAADVTADWLVESAKRLADRIDSIRRPEDV